MGTLQLEDLLRDELAEGGRVGAWECALQTLFLRPGPTELSRIRTLQIKSLIPRAITNLHAWIRQAHEVGAARRIDPNNELPRILEGLIALEKALDVSATSQDSRMLQLCVREMIDEEVFQFLGQQDQFYRQLTIQMEQLESELKGKLKAGVSELEAGLGEVGIARSDHLRKARSESVAVADSNTGDFCTASALIAALASWKMTRGLEETKRLLRRAWGRAQRESDAVSGPIARFLGHLEWSDDEPELAWSAMHFAADRSIDADTLLETASLAIQLKKWDQARSLVAKGLKGSPLFTLRVLACDCMIEIVGDVLEGLVQQQKVSRQSVGTELAAWNADLNRIKQAGKKANSRFDFLDEVDASRKEVAERIATVDHFFAIALACHAKNGRQEAMQVANYQLGAEYSDAVRRLESTQIGTDQAWAEREAMIEAAIERQSSDVQTAREALQQALSESSKNQAGSTVAMGSGCGAFLLYLFIAAFLAAQGINAGFGTIFGWFGLAASGTPIVIAILAQLAHGAHRAALDKALHDKIRLADAAYDVAAKKADRFYREKVIKLREGLEDVEARAKCLEGALKVLNQGA